MIDHRLKLFLCTCFFIFSPSLSWAWTSWFVPHESGQWVYISNPTTEPETLYVSGPGPIPGVDQEIILEVPSLKSIHFKIQDLPQSWSFIHFKSQNSRLRLFWSQSRKPIPSESGQNWSLQELQYDQYQLINTTALPIKWKKGWLYPYESQVIPQSQMPLEFSTDYRTILWGEKNGVWEPLLKNPTPIKLSALNKGVYFRVSNSEKDQSFIVHIEDPALISNARRQIQEPNAPLPRLVIAEIDESHGNHNRDIRSNASSLTWSWHVVRVLGFSHFGSQECDGSPKMLEQVLSSWLKKSKGICFWNYRIIEELDTNNVVYGH